MPKIQVNYYIASFQDRIKIDLLLIILKRKLQEMVLEKAQQLLPVFYFGKVLQKMRLKV